MDHYMLPPPAARRLLREAVDLSLADIGGIVGVTRSAVSRWERGERRPRGENRRRYAAVLAHLRSEVLPDD